MKILIVMISCLLLTGCGMTHILGGRSQSALSITVNIEGNDNVVTTVINGVQIDPSMEAPSDVKLPPISAFSKKDGENVEVKKEELPNGGVKLTVEVKKSVE